MRELRVIKELETCLNGGESLYIVDINGDGKEEFIFRQSPGMLDSKFYKNGWHGYITDENANLFQLTCMTQDGETVWKIGSPWMQETPYNSHSGMNMTLFCDLWNDGRMIGICIRKDQLSLIDAKSGSIIKTVKLKTEAYNYIGIQKIKEEGYHIIIKCDGESEYGYGKPIAAYNANLELLWEQTNLTGGGHNIVFKDIDNDGCDEIFEGYNLLDHDGRILWSFDFPSHSDQTVVDDINADGIDEVIYCTDSEDFIIVNTKGEHLVTRSDFPHPQKVVVGHFIKGLVEKQIFMCNRATHGGAVLLNSNAENIWEFPCNGYGSLLQENGEDLILFEPGPGRMSPELQNEYIKKAKEMGYDNLPISGNAGFEALVINGEGKVIYRFPHLADSIDVTKWGLPARQKGDFGAGFSIKQYDIDHDGEIEFVIYNRNHVWILK